MLRAADLPNFTTLRLPARFQINHSHNGLRVCKLLALSTDANITLEAYRSRGPTCRRALARTGAGASYVIEFAAFSDTYGEQLSGVIRAKPGEVTGPLLDLHDATFREDVSSLRLANRLRDEVTAAWSAGIQYRSELTDDRGAILRSGFRQPQIGALHAIASHWTVSDEPALIVMPTGTGKTEVMIAASIAACARRMLIVVPTDPLRQQTADKFITYGILQRIGIIDALPYPVVGIVSSALSSAHFPVLERCNVIVATMAAIGLSENSLQQRFAALFTHVCFDEAHHIQAATWKRFHSHCSKLRTVLLTATPYREDGKSIEGKMIYDYPLSAAQALGYFQPIRFVEVFEPDETLADRRIAEAAVGRLREDLDAGHDHILIARASTIDAATSLYNDIYQPQYGDLNPVLLHSRTPRRQQVLQAIRGRQHKIIVCVDMFGEGFDMPSLKVAALHSIHKSLGITLQFIGRFARAAAGVGAASFVANTAEDAVPEALEGLYRDDSDWNLLLPDLSYDAIDPQARLSSLVNNLEAAQGGDQNIEISTVTLRPKISAQVYRATEFRPERFRNAFRASQRILQPQISRRDNFLLLLVNQREWLDWTDSRDIVVDSWDLYLAYFDPNRGHLYIHSSRKGDSTGRLAAAISTAPGSIRGEDGFKVFAGLRRLTLFSVGLSSRSRNVRYQMFAGLDVRSAIDPLQQQSKVKANITGVGYENGIRHSVGCSRKGKLWSMRSGSIAEWRSWCDLVGAKLADPNITPDDFLRYTLIPTSVNVLPTAEALMADWPDQLFESLHFRFEVITAGETFEFDDCQIDLVEWNAGGNSFQFSLRSGEARYVQFRLTVAAAGNGDDSYTVERVDGEDLEIVALGKKQPAAEFFQENPPLVRLADGSQLSGNILLKPQEELGDTFDRTLIRTIDWNGVDITKETRWKDGVFRPDSVQQRFIEHLQNGPAVFIIDDDDTGESADVVAIEEGDERIVVHLWHCKYSSGDTPGHRAHDLYEVCGQAQKSVKWTWNLRTLVTHLMNRETKHRRGRVSRFVTGSLAELATLRKASRRKFVDYRIGIVQPGLSKGNVAPEYLTMLGATNAFVQCITNSPLAVVTSE